MRSVDLELHFCNALSNAKMYEMYILMSGTNFVFMTFRVGDVSGFENVCVVVEI